MSSTTVLDDIRNRVRSFMHKIAVLLNKLSNGKLKPSTVTFTSLFAHIPIAIFIGGRHFVIAGLLLVVFGLLDSLDGELARLQNRASNAGMLLDASTDRMKEILLYLGAAYAFVTSDRAGWAVWAVAACGTSLLVSYIKAKGETAVRDAKLSANEVNRLFQDGFMRYEVRMAMLVFALLLNKLELAVLVIAILSWWTAMNRLMTISDKLQHDKA